MNDQPNSERNAVTQLSRYSLLDALRDRRSRRFGAGMCIPSGPLAYKSRFGPVPLSEEEEAALAFAACGITGYALADLCYERGEGGNIMAGLVGRTIAAGDAIQCVALVVTNDDGTYLLKRPRDFPDAEIGTLIRAATENKLSGIYRSSRVRFRESRSAPSKEPLFNINVNRWSVNAPGSTYFLPINDLTLMYINGLLEIFNETTGAFVLDERANFLPAGIGRFARSRGGHLEDDPKLGRLATVKHIELMVAEFTSIEQGMMLQNLGLAAQALGLGGFPNFANHEFGWFQALGFRMGSMPASRYLGMNAFARTAARLLRRNPVVPFPIGLEHKGEVLLKPFCPPYFHSMRAAVEAVLQLKFGPRGVFRGQSGSAWLETQNVTKRIPELSDRAVEATVAYCEYLWQRYGRFPVHLAPFRTVVGFQAVHLDAEFYNRFYQPGALSETQRQDFARWSASAPGAQTTTPVGG
ncbi:MAG: hypothetical protein L0Z50_19820 [Verrucomicrobiales bacterium]|nr:hypothetical protein [Verrucomicrobiales bacterium]